MNRLLITAFAIAAIFMAARLTNAQEEKSELEGKPAPDVVLKTLDGKDFKLSALKGDVVVLDFWATWCPPCRKSLPHLQALNDDKARAEKGLKVFAVNAREKKDVVEKYMKDNTLSFTVPMDAAGDSLKAYQVQGIPTTVVVGRDGNVKKVFVGFGGEASEKALDAAIDEALKAEKPKAAVN